LRQLTPDRALTWAEVHAVAERQATLLLSTSHVAEPPVPQFIICNLPGISVDWRPDWPTDAMAVQTGRWWRIVIRSSVVVQRQRFSLAHEFKHVLDDPFIDHLFSDLPPQQRRERAERLCNYFAACLLMPRSWIKRDWGNGRQRVAELARRYFVSQEAMTTRLSELGLTHMTLALDEGSSRHAGAAA
jgi:predicted transcriptional regulator